MLGTRGCERVGANTTVGGGNLPMRFQPSSFEHALQGGIEGALFDLQQFVGGLFNMLRQCITVQTPALQGTQDHHLQRTRKEISLVGCFHLTALMAVPKWLSLCLEQNSIGRYACQLNSCPGERDRPPQPPWFGRPGHPVCHRGSDVAAGLDMISLARSKR